MRLARTGHTRIQRVSTLKLTSFFFLNKKFNLSENLNLCQSAPEIGNVVLKSEIGNRPALRRVGANEGREGLDDLIGQQLMLAPSTGADEAPYVVVGVSPCLDAADHGQVTVAPAWYTTLGLDTAKAPKHEKALFVQLGGEETRRLVADTHRKALVALARGRSTLAAAGGAPLQLRPGMQVSVLYGFNVKGGIDLNKQPDNTNTPQ